MKKKSQEYKLKKLNNLNLKKTLKFLFLLYIFFYYLKILDNKNINIIESCKKSQLDFCNNFNNNINFEIEKKIRLFDVSINNISYNIYSTKKIMGLLTYQLSKNKVFEKYESLNILKALTFYGSKKKILNNKDICMLDIGGNIGWYPSFLGRYGYTILTFEPFYQNFYISLKNYCHLNRNSNVIIINKGFDTEERICSYYRDKNSALNGMTLCNNDKGNINIVRERFKKVGNVSLTRLKNFIPYLANKNIALIKLDIEGAEEKAIKSGIELITRFHVPFIFIEFTPKLLIKHKSNPSDFIQFFIDNDYAISLNGFLEKSFITLEELLIKTKSHLNIYLIYKKFIDLY